MSFPHVHDPYAALAGEISKLRDQLRALQTGPFRIPVLAADPATTDPTNIWAFADGRIRMRYRDAGGSYVIKEWAAVVTPGASTSATAIYAQTAAPISRTGSWSATWSAGYAGSGAARADVPTLVPWGNAGDAYGRNRGLLGFDYAAIATALASSTITGVRLTGLNLNSFYGTGSETYLGVHNYTAAPGTWAGGGIPLPQNSHQIFPHGEPATLTLPIVFGTMLRDGTGKGISVEAPNDGREYYGLLAGVSSGYTVPKLEIDYSK